MQPVRHQSLDLQGLWKIVWFGKLTQLTGSTHDHKLQAIRTYLRKLADSSDQGIKSGKVVGDFKLAHIPIGELARLRIGTLIEDGIPITSPFRLFSNEAEYKVALNYDETNLSIFNRYEKYNNEYIVRPGREDIDREGENNNLFLGIREGDNPYRYIIPCVEVFRFFYATSNVLANALLTDKFLNPDKYLWDQKASILESPPGRRALLWLRKHMLDADAPYLARFAWDSYALSKAQDIFLYGAASAIKSGFERMIYAKPPIQGLHMTQFIAKAQPSYSSSILINRLISCDWIPQYTELKWDRDNDGRSNPNENIEDELPAHGWPLVKPALNDIHHPEELYVDKANPNRKPSKIDEEEISTRFPKLEEIPAEKRAQLQTGNRRAPAEINRYLQEAFGGTVVEGSSSESLLGSTMIQAPLRERGSVQATDVDERTGMVDYLSIMKNLQLATKSGYIVVEYIKVTEHYKNIESVPFNVFPPSTDKKKQKWLYIDGAYRYRRMVLVAKIIRKINDVSRYIIELQPKRAGEFSTLVLWNNLETEISLATIERILDNFLALKAAKIENGVHYGLHWGRLRHTTSYTGDEEQAHHFIDRVFNALPVDT